MFCPYCDSLIRELPDNYTCPRCGGILLDVQKPADFNLLAPPIGVYKQTFGYMEIDKTSVRFYYKFWVGDVVDRRIPFSHIVNVIYQPGRGFKSGFLSVRSKENQNEPWPKNSFDAASDRTSVIFIDTENDAYKKVYYFLKQWADRAITEGTEV